METDDLIRAIAADARQSRMPLSRAWWLAVVAAIGLAALLFATMLGLRPDILTAMHDLRFWFKFVVTLSLAVSAFAIVQIESRPEGKAGSRALLLLLAPALLAAGIALELSVLPTTAWMPRLIGTNNMLCLTFIPLIGIGPLAVFLAVLRHGAPAHPTSAGAVAGLLAGAMAATYYAAHCPDDSPLFVAAWYTIGVAGLALVGALLARPLARW